jgi:hypothetical protein
MRISHLNTSVLIFTCLIQRSDESRMSSLISAIRCLDFSYKTCTVSTPGSLSERQHRLPPVLPFLVLLPPTHQGAGLEEADK